MPEISSLLFPWIPEGVWALNAARDESIIAISDRPHDSKPNQA